MITTVNTPPQIKQCLDWRMLLYGSIEYYNFRLKEIEKYARRKIRDQDIGKLKAFKKLYDEFMDVYERKKTEEEEYKEEVKNQKKRSYIPNKTCIARFKKF